ncbi:MAG: hypothetical protein KGL95_02030 [Patescibacteria group bacterium]|nr:hypothetical protein [Patescibacteria group bacterium]
MNNAFRNKGHRAVAPIIATLLMVAIAVVGGILIFVFAQGFFSNSSIQGPTFETVQVLGSDFRLIAPAVAAGLEDVANPPTSQIFNVGSASASTTLLKAQDMSVIWLKNGGNAAVSLSKVTVNGISYTGPTVPTTFNVAGTANVCTAGTFYIDKSVTVAAGTGGADVSGTTISSIPAGTLANLVLCHGGTGFTNLRVGQPVTVVMTTGNGGTFNWSTIVGTATQ